jgi:hypothetical protein
MCISEVLCYSSGGDIGSWCSPYVSVSVRLTSHSTLPALACFVRV